MPCSESNKIRSFNATRPRPGLCNPAMHCSNIVLPAPEAPRMLSGASDAQNETLSWKSGRSFSIWTSSAMSTCHPTSASKSLRARPVIQAAKESERNYNIHGAPGQRTLRFIGFHRKINGDWNRLRLPGDVSSDHQRGTEFPESASKREYRAGQHSRPSKRQRDFPKYAPFRCTQCSRGVQQCGLHLFESGARGEVHQREGNNGGSDHSGGPGKNYGCAKLKQQLTERTMAPKKKKKKKADDSRRQNQRQEENSIHQNHGRSGIAFAPDGRCQAEHECDCSGGQAGRERYPERRQVHRQDCSRIRSFRMDYSGR